MSAHTENPYSSPLPETSAPAARAPRWAVGGLVGSLCLLGVNASSNQDLMVKNGSLVKEVAVLTHTKHDLIGQNETLTANLKAKSEESEMRGHEIVSLTTQLNKTKEDLVNEQGAHTKTKGELLAANKSIESLKGDVAVANKKIEGLNMDLTAAAEREATQKNTIASLEKTKTELTATVEAKTQQIVSLEADKLGLVKTTDEKSAQITSLETEKVSLAEQIEVARRLETTLRADILAGINRESEANKLVAMKGEQIVQMDAGIGNLNKALAEQQQQNTTLAETNQLMSQDLTAAKTAVEQLTTARDDLNKRIEDLNKQIEALQAADKAKESAMLEIQTQKSATETKMAELEKERDALKVEREQLSTACNELMKKLQELSKQVRTLQEDFVTLSRIKEESAASILSNNIP